MAGRILPVALATILGVTISVATFDGEFKEQRRKRLQEEYDREVAAAAAPAQQGPSSKPVAPSVPATNETPPQPAAQTYSNPWSSIVGLWAWEKKTPVAGTAATQQTHSSGDNPESKNKP